MKILRKDKMYYVRYMVRLGSSFYTCYIPCHYIPEQKIDIKKDRCNFGRFTV